MTDELWENLPPELLETILARLSFRDNLCFASVCKSWLQVQTDHRTHHALSATQFPWIMFPWDHQSRHQRLFYSHTDQRHYYLPVPLFDGVVDFCGVFHGWSLILQLNGSCQFVFLVNLLTEDTIKIPFTDDHALTFLPVDGALSSDPTNPDCVVVLWQDNAIYLCRINDRKWETFYNFAYPKEIVYLVPAISGERIYVETSESILVVIELHSVIRETFFGKLVLPLTKPSDRFWVESDQDLLLVYLFLEGGNIQRFDIFKADFTQSTWIDVKDLGNKVLFLGDRPSLCLPASTTGGPANRIYYTRSFSSSTEGSTRTPLWIEYDFASNTVVSEAPSYLTEQAPESMASDYFHWLMPSLCRPRNCER